MTRYFTADPHYGHSKIILYTGRPFRDCDHMNKHIINEANMRVKPEDECICVGDFCMGNATKSKEFKNRLHGKWTYIRGNHDKNQGTKTLCDWMFLRMAHYQAFVSHIPYYYTEVVGTAKYILPDALIDFVEEFCDFSICGHVHDSWSVSLEGKIPTINVGVDVRNFRPMSEDEIIKEFNACK